MFDTSRTDIEYKKWFKEPFNDLYFDDALWAYAMRGSEESRLENQEALYKGDLTLDKLFAYGWYDWEGKDDRFHQATQAIRHSTALSSRLLRRIVDLEHQVHLSAFRRLMSNTERGFHLG